MHEEPRRDPLDFLFTPTADQRAAEASVAVIPRPAEPTAPTSPTSPAVSLDHADSAVPVRAGRTRSRAGNAMARTRAAVLDGAKRAMTRSGTAITMTEVAAECGIAKATLYNHFRSREALLDAVLADEVAAVIDAGAGLPLADALSAAAQRIGTSALLARLIEDEPATVAALARIDLRSAHWRAAADALRAELERARRGGGELVLRWLSSYLTTAPDPAFRDSIGADASALVRALPLLG